MCQIEKYGVENGWAEEAEEEGGGDEAEGDARLVVVWIVIGEALLPNRKHFPQLDRKITV